MTTLSDSAIAQLAANAGFSGGDQTKAVAVALAESGGNPNAQNPSGADGLWQVMWKLHGFTGNPFDPQTNANAAYQVFKMQGWGAWTTYTSGAYLVYMGRANVATNGATGNGGSPNSASATPVANTGSGIAGLQTITMGGLWIRVGAFLLGTFLLIEGLLRATGANKTIVQAAKGIAVEAMG